MAAMSDLHRLFLQTFMSHGSLSSTEVLDKFEQTGIRCNDRTTSLAECVNVINANLRDLQLEIKKANDEHDGAPFYVLVNRCDSDVTKLSTEYSSCELELLKLLLQKLVTSGSGTLSSVEALNLTDQLQKRMSKSDAEDFYTRLEKEKWLSKSDRGRFYLSPRGVAELEGYILKSYEDDAVKCHVCAKLCLMGQSCEMCNTALHRHCAAKLFRGKSSPQCPGVRGPGEKCNAPWTHKIPHSTASPPNKQEVNGDEKNAGCSSQEASRKRRR